MEKNLKKYWKKIYKKIGKKFTKKFGLWPKNAWKVKPGLERTDTYSRDMAFCAVRREPGLYLQGLPSTEVHVLSTSSNSDVLSFRSGLVDACCIVYRTAAKVWPFKLCNFICLLSIKTKPFLAKNQTLRSYHSICFADWVGITWSYSKQIFNQLFLTSLQSHVGLFECFPFISFLHSFFDSGIHCRNDEITEVKKQYEKRNSQGAQCGKNQNMTSNRMSQKS